MRPLLAAKVDLTKLEYPVYASVKLDGIRCLIQDGVAYSRKWKPLPNQQLQEWAKNLRYTNYTDGELIIGRPDDKGVFRTTMSTIMSYDKDIETNPDYSHASNYLRYYVFDHFQRPENEWNIRRTYLSALDDSVFKLKQAMVVNEEGLLNYYDDSLLAGYEGIMVRSPDAPYKMGRSTVNQGYLLKLKPIADDEAVVIGYEEKLHNCNEVITDERGYTKRSNAKGGMIPTGTLGSLKVQNKKGQIFNVGTGFTEDERNSLWTQRSALINRTITYTYQAEGSYNVPRFPVFKGFRGD